MCHIRVIQQICQDVTKLYTSTLYNIIIRSSIHAIDALMKGTTRKLHLVNYMYTSYMATSASFIQ